MDEEIDNMEGLDVPSSVPTARPMIILVSDDNHSILQRSCDAGIQARRLTSRSTSSRSVCPDQGAARAGTAAGIGRTMLISAP